MTALLSKAKMILSQIAWVDCCAFLLFLAPRLLIHVGLIATAKCALKALPHLRASTISLPANPRAG